MLHFKVNQPLYCQRNQTAPLRGKSHWPVLDNQLLEFTDPADMQAQSPFFMVVSFKVLQFSMMHYLNVAHFNIVTFPVALIVCCD